MSSVQVERTQADMDIALEELRHSNNIDEINAQSRGRQS
jgi:hypothetical protein